MKESTTPPISPKKEIDTVNKTEKPQKSNKTAYTPRSNKSENIIIWINQGLLKEVTQKTQ